MDEAGVIKDGHALRLVLEARGAKMGPLAAEELFEDLRGSCEGENAPPLANSFWPKVAET